MHKPQIRFDGALNAGSQYFDDRLLTIIECDLVYLCHRGGSEWLFAEIPERLIGRFSQRGLNEAARFSRVKCWYFILKFGEFIGNIVWE